MQARSLDPDRLTAQQKGELRWLREGEENRGVGKKLGPSTSAVKYYS